MPKYKLSGRVVALTGATGGLGAALAKALHERGAKLALFDLDAEKVTEQARCFGSDAVARGWIVDVRDFESVTAAMDAAAEHFGGIDVVVASAGIGSMAPLESQDPALWDAVIDINLSGVWRTFRAAFPHVKKRKGYMLAISSMAAFVHSPLNASYTASKAGVWALCDSTRLDVRHYGIDVGSAHPTFFKTPMMDSVHVNEAGTEIWKGNKSGLWKMIALEPVVNEIVRGIEKRKNRIVVPRIQALPARIPGIAQPIVDKIGFPGTTIPDAIAKVKNAGWLTNR